MAVTFRRSLNRKKNRVGEGDEIFARLRSLNFTQNLTSFWFGSFNRDEQGEYTSDLSSLNFT